MGIGDRIAHVGYSVGGFVSVTGPEKTIHFIDAVLDGADAGIKFWGSRRFKGQQEFYATDKIKQLKAIHNDRLHDIRSHQNWREGMAMRTHPHWYKSHFVDKNENQIQMLMTMSPEDIEKSSYGSDHHAFWVHRSKTAYKNFIQQGGVVAFSIDGPAERAEDYVKKLGLENNENVAYSAGYGTSVCVYQYHAGVQNAISGVQKEDLINAKLSANSIDTLRNCLKENNYLYNTLIFANNGKEELFATVADPSIYSNIKSSDAARLARRFTKGDIKMDDDEFNAMTRNKETSYLILKNHRSPKDNKDFKKDPLRAIQQARLDNMAMLMEIVNQADKDPSKLTELKKLGFQFGQEGSLVVVPLDENTGKACDKINANKLIAEKKGIEPENVGSRLSSVSDAMHGFTFNDVQQFINEYQKNNPLPTGTPEAVKEYNAEMSQAMLKKFYVLAPEIMERINANGLYHAYNGNDPDAIELADVTREYYENVAKSSNAIDLIDHDFETYKKMMKVAFSNDGLRSSIMKDWENRYNTYNAPGVSSDDKRLFNKQYNRKYQSRLDMIANLIKDMRVYDINGLSIGNSSIDENLRMQRLEEYNNSVNSSTKEIQTGYNNVFAEQNGKQQQDLVFKLLGAYMNNDLGQPDLLASLGIPQDMQFTVDMDTIYACIGAMSRAKAHGKPQDAFPDIAKYLFGSMHTQIIRETLLPRFSSLQQTQLSQMGLLTQDVIDLLSQDPSIDINELKDLQTKQSELDAKMQDLHKVFDQPYQDKIPDIIKRFKDNGKEQYALLEAQKKFIEDQINSDKIPPGKAKDALDKIQARQNDLIKEQEEQTQLIDMLTDETKSQQNSDKIDELTQKCKDYENDRNNNLASFNDAKSELSNLAKQRQAEEQKRQNQLINMLNTYQALQTLQLEEEAQTNDDLLLLFSRDPKHERIYRDLKDLKEKHSSDLTQMQNTSKRFGKTLAKEEISAILEEFEDQDRNLNAYFDEQRKIVQQEVMLGTITSDKAKNYLDLIDKSQGERQQVQKERMQLLNSITDLNKYDENDKKMKDLIDRSYAYSDIRDENALIEAAKELISNSNIEQQQVTELLKQVNSNVEKIKNNQQTYTDLVNNINKSTKELLVRFDGDSTHVGIVNTLTTIKDKVANLEVIPAQLDKFKDKMGDYLFDIWEDISETKNSIKILQEECAKLSDDDPKKIEMNNLIINITNVIQFLPQTEPNRLSDGKPTDESTSSAGKGCVKVNSDGSTTIVVASGKDKASIDELKKQANKLRGQLWHNFVLETNNEQSISEGRNILGEYVQCFKDMKEIVSKSEPNIATQQLDIAIKELDAVTSQFMSGDFKHKYTRFQSLQEVLKSASMVYGIANNGVTITANDDMVVTVAGVPTIVGKYKDGKVIQHDSNQLIKDILSQGDLSLNQVVEIVHEKRLTEAKELCTKQEEYIDGFDDPQIRKSNSIGYNLYSGIVKNEESFLSRCKNEGIVTKIIKVDGKEKIVIIPKDTTIKAHFNKGEHLGSVSIKEKNLSLLPEAVLISQDDVTPDRFRELKEQAIPLSIDNIMKNDKLLDKTPADTVIDIILEQYEGRCNNEKDNELKQRLKANLKSLENKQFRAFKCEQGFVICPMTMFKDGNKDIHLKSPDVLIINEDILRSLEGRGINMTFFENNLGNRLYKGEYVEKSDEGSNPNITDTIIIKDSDEFFKNAEKTSSVNTQYNVEGNPPIWTFDGSESNTTSTQTENNASNLFNIANEKKSAEEKDEEEKSINKQKPKDVLVNIYDKYSGESDVYNFGDMQKVSGTLENNQEENIVTDDKYENNTLNEMENFGENIRNDIENNDVERYIDSLNLSPEDKEKLKAKISVLIEKSNKRKAVKKELKEGEQAKKETEEGIANLTNLYDLAMNDQGEFSSAESIIASGNGTSTSEAPASDGLGRGMQ